MSGFLLDTNVVSEMVSRRPDPRVLDWLSSVDGTLLHLSVLTLGELRKGIAKVPQGRRRSRLESWLEVDIPAWFAGRVLIVDEAIAHRWGALTSMASQQGRILPVVDALIAATAQHHNMTVVSRNTKDYAVANVPIVDPWRE